jgi:hypothetical protein
LSPSSTWRSVRKRALYQRTPFTLDLAAYFAEVFGEDD